MSEALNRQIIQAFKANFKNEDVVIPGALRQESQNIVFTSLIDPNERQMMNKDTALSPLALADLFASPGGMPSEPQPQLPPGTMDNQGPQAQGMQPQPQPTNPQQAPVAPPTAPPQGAQPPAQGPQPQPAPQATPGPQPQDMAKHLLLG